MKFRVEGFYKAVWHSVLLQQAQPLVLHKKIKMQLNLVAHFEKTGIGKMSFCKEQKKSAAFATDLFGRGRRDSFSSLDARRSGRLYRAKGHGIHCRPILVLLQEANKKIGCFCNRPFWQTHTFGIRTFYRNGRMVIFL